MSIEFKCSCGSKLKVGDEHAGAKVRCPNCKAISVAPTGSPAPIPPPPSPPEPIAPPPQPVAAPIPEIRAENELAEFVPEAAPQPETSEPPQVIDLDPSAVIEPGNLPKMRHDRLDRKEEDERSRRRGRTIRCPECDERNDEDEPRCVRCGHRLQERPRASSGLDSLIPYKNALALWAYYVGVFALIPCIGFPLGIASLVLGIMGVRYANRNPQAKGKGHAIAGIVLGALVVIGHIAAVIIIIIAAASNKR